MSDNGNKTKNWSKAKVIDIRGHSNILGAFDDDFFKEWTEITFAFFAKYELSQDEAIALHRKSAATLENVDPDD